MPYAITMQDESFARLAWLLREAQACGTSAPVRLQQQQLEVYHNFFMRALYATLHSKGRNYPLLLDEEKEAPPLPPSPLRCR